MIVLDTNVLSEVIKVAPHPAVRNWFIGLQPASVCITAVTEAELRYGAEILPDGKRKTSLLKAIDSTITLAKGGGTVPFDREAAEQFALIAAARRRSGRPTSLPDCQIAAIVRARNLVLATRNIKDFTDCGIALVDPWKA
ncbi:type II toxin-antitoxin system VapC family toxin [Aurantimonas sp. 22II-16-19i]|uniref:type II toxin-antitoxin system VapC family toxin n=1 Tax=Aurantimonas sp. 22II-16-19i TaxID=1317114 RepID=UPI0009F7FB29|nr:type II toxin-antitoxin system VapC family toxin [Aurantimonas sp. 22II-16-19i]ORE97200.1 PilT domain-containing protein [Aurantimonas sp. 22II-16-19i]